MGFDNVNNLNSLVNFVSEECTLGDDGVEVTTATTAPSSSSSSTETAQSEEIGDSSAERRNRKVCPTVEDDTRRDENAKSVIV